MKRKQEYSEKLSEMLAQTGIEHLPGEQRAFLESRAQELRFTQQELRRLGEICLDLNMWGTPSIQAVWPRPDLEGLAPKQVRQRILGHLEAYRQDLREAPNRYPAGNKSMQGPEARIKRVSVDRPRLGLGWCPVASPRTRCCNLLTLDAVENCGFDCSYCSIQSFYHGDEVRFDRGFAEKLEGLKLDPGLTYHIGTGQSSDSLMWGNREGILDALIRFAAQHPNIILELKTKSKNVGHLLKHAVPPNILVTWSLNTPTLIANEEHLTASLDARLDAARRVADKGILVGFHFHPMIHYDRWREDYGVLFERLTRMFTPKEVALVSLGTLTYIKPVLKKLRARAGFRSKILQMPMEESNGKLTYPEPIKREMFTHAYSSLSPWHGQVFFYLCMENQRLWKPVFGFEYSSNDEFEQAMKAAYLEKIRRGA